VAGDLAREYALLDSIVLPILSAIDVDAALPSLRTGSRRGCNKAKHRRNHCPVHEQNSLVLLGRPARVPRFVSENAPNMLVPH
jgi:hypothetical protein